MSVRRPRGGAKRMAGGEHVQELLAQASAGVLLLAVLLSSILVVLRRRSLCQGERVEREARRAAERAAGRAPWGAEMLEPLQDPLGVGTMYDSDNEPGEIDLCLAVFALSSEWPSNAIAQSATFEPAAGRIRYRAPRPGGGGGESHGEAHGDWPPSGHGARHATGLAAELGKSFGGLEAGLRAPAAAALRAFWVAWPSGSGALFGSPWSPGLGKSPSIDEAVVRRAFGGSIDPGAALRVERLARGGGGWWEELLADVAGEPDEAELLQRWDTLIQWFADRGVERRLWAPGVFVSVDRGPNCTFRELPRMVLALTADRASLVGLFGWVMHED